LGDAPTATPAFIFSRHYRLLSPAAFQRVFKQATRSGDRYFTILWRSNDVQTARIGFAIAKKRIASAVRRNRIRRLTRESFRQNRNELSNVDIVIMAQPAAQQASNAQLFKSLEHHWNKIRFTDSAEAKFIDRSPKGTAGDKK